MILSPVFIAEGRTSKGKGPQALEALEIMAINISRNIYLLYTVFSFSHPSP